MTKQKGHVLGLSCHLKPGRASQNPRGLYRNEPQTSLNRAATGVSAGLSIRLQVSEMLEQPVLEGASSRSPWTPCTPLYKKQSTPDVLVKARAKRTALRTQQPQEDKRALYHLHSAMACELTLGQLLRVPSLPFVSNRKMVPSG